MILIGKEINSGGSVRAYFVIELEAKSKKQALDILKRNTDFRLEIAHYIRNKETINKIRRALRNEDTLVKRDYTGLLIIRGT